MAGINEINQWEPIVYQLEDGDPAGGGPDGIVNIPNKHLANRTLFLKTFADEVQQARGDKESLQERLDLYDLYDPDTRVSIIATFKEALSMAGLANKELAKTLNQRFQSGEVVLTNRGVINGCVVSISTDAARNLNLTAGKVFTDGIVYPVEEQLNSSLIPPNDTAEEQLFYSYVEWGGTNFVHGCDDVFPDDAIPLYEILVPAGNTGNTQAEMDAVSLVDIRRVEPNFPREYLSAPYIDVPLPFAYTDKSYNIQLDVTGFVGSRFQLGDVFISDRQTNGFKIATNGTADGIVVRWSTSQLKL